jgi:hypothetical protein
MDAYTLIAQPLGESLTAIIYDVEGGVVAHSPVSTVIQAKRWFYKFLGELDEDYQVATTELVMNAWKVEEANE